MLSCLSLHSWFVVCLICLIRIKTTVKTLSLFGAHGVAERNMLLMFDDRNKKEMMEYCMQNSTIFRRLHEAFDVLMWQS